MNLNAAFTTLSTINERYISVMNEFEAVVSEQEGMWQEIREGAKEATRNRRQQPDYIPQPKKAFCADVTELLKCQAVDDKKDKLNQHVERLRSALSELKTIKHELQDLRLRVDKRGFGIFKHGGIKQRMDTTVSIRMLNDLKKDIKSCLDAYHDIYLKFIGCDFPSIEPVLTWHKSYEKNKEIHHSRTLDMTKTMGYAVLS